MLQAYRCTISRTSYLSILVTSSIPSGYVSALFTLSHLRLISLVGTPALPATEGRPDGSVCLGSSSSLHVGLPPPCFRSIAYRLTRYSLALAHTVLESVAYWSYAPFVLLAVILVVKIQIDVRSLLSLSDMYSRFSVR